MSIHITLDDITPCLIQNTLVTTLTNYGYLMYTLNMLKSLKPFGLDKNIFIIALDQKSHMILKDMGYNTICCKEESLSGFFPWNSKGYDKVCYYKVELIYHILSLGKNILLIDGDIVFNHNPVYHIHLWEHAPEDVWIQNDSASDEDLTNMCTGYMFIRSSSKLIQLYDCISPEGIEKYKKCAFDNNDQTYFNIYVKPECGVKALPLALYPNGNIFYYMPELKEHAVLIHFNWAKGHEKMAKMKEHQMWLLTPEEEEF